MSSGLKQESNKKLHKFIKKMANTWVFTTGIGTAVLSLLFVIINTVLNNVAKHDHISIGFVIFLYLFCALFSASIAAAVFLFPAIPALSRYFIDENVLKDYNNSSTKNKELTEDLKIITGDISSDLKDTAEELRNIADTFDKNITASNEIKEHFASCSVGRFKLILAAEFFNQLDRAKANASERVCLTSFSTRVYRDNKNFLNDEIDYCKNHSAQVRRIITIHSEGKFNIYKNVIENIDTHIDNWKIAYLDIDEFEDTKLPGIIGLQVLDDEVFIMNPITARITNPQIFSPNKLIIINDKETADIFEEYFIKLWNEIESSCEKGRIDYKKGHIGHKGYILYDGEKNYSADDNIWAEINKRIPKKNRLTSV